MPKFEVEVAHQLGQAEALARVQNMIGNLRERYSQEISGLSESWEGPNGTFAFRAMGINIKGTVAVSNTEVDINGDLPMLAAPFKGQIEEMIRTEAQQLLAPATS